MSVGTPPNAIVYSSGYNSQRDGKSRLPLDFINSNGNNINEYISSSSFWNWIMILVKELKVVFIFITELT